MTTKKHSTGHQTNLKALTTQEFNLKPIKTKKTVWKTLQPEWWNKSTQSQEHKNKHKQHIKERLSNLTELMSALTVDSKVTTKKVLRELLKMRKGGRRGGRRLKLAFTRNVVKTLVDKMLVKGNKRMKNRVTRNFENLLFARVQ